MLTLNGAIYLAFLTATLGPLVVASGFYGYALKSRSHSLVSFLACGVMLAGWMPIMLFAPKMLTGLFLGL